MKILFRSFLALVLIQAALLGSSGPADADSAKTIMIASPAINGGQDLGFLRKGIVDMLSTRLSAAGKVNVLTPAPEELSGVGGGDRAVLKEAREKGADYVVITSLTIIGGSVSTDAKVLDAVSEQPVVTFGQSGRDQADIIDHIDKLASLINERLFDRAAPSAGAPAVPVPVVKAPSPNAAPPAADIHQHPEKLLAKPLASDKGADAPGAAPAGDGQEFSGQLLMRGRRLDAQLRGVASGDLDGDGRQEVVCMESRGFQVYRVENGQFVKTTEMSFGGNNVAVDTADLNGNGKAEIFVTDFDNSGSGLNSYVMEWDGNAFRRTDERLRWYFRTLDLPGRGPVLAGQRQGLDGPFQAGVYEIQWSGGQYEGGARLPVPARQTLFGVGIGQVRSAGSDDIVAYSSSGYVRILDRTGDEEWVSTERYGGGTESIEYPDKEDPKEKQSLHLAPRLRVLDIDKDGLSEILVLYNEDALEVFARTRLFKSGRLALLKWDQLGMSRIWGTREISKYISDFTLMDVDGDGNPEVIAAVVTKGGSTLGSGSSFLAVFKLPFAEKPAS